MIVRRCAVVVILCALVAGSSGCVGRMAITRGAYKFNVDTVENRWGQEALFLGMLILPVYEFCFLIDAAVINTIEFWTGKNPINDESAVGES